MFSAVVKESKCQRKEQCIRRNKHLQVEEKGKVRGRKGVIKDKLIENNENII